MDKRIVVLGGGITGRLVKRMIPEATIFEKSGPNATYTSELGVHVSIIPIPQMKSRKYTRFIQIDGQNPTLELIQKYKKKIQRDGDISYGDCRQFEPVQTVYVQEFPKDVDIEFGMECTGINLETKCIYFGEMGCKYDILISTIPLPILVNLTNLFEHFKEQASAFFMHRPIYLMRESLETEPNVIRENYVTDSDSPVYRENFIDGWKNSESLYKIEPSFKIYPGKIYNNSYTPHILDDLQNFGVYCVGRYAEWDNRIHIWNSYSKIKTIRDLLLVAV